MDKITTEFYEAHKDKTFTYPKLPNDINEKVGVQVAKFVLQLMIDNKIGWLELDFKSVNKPDYEDLAFDYKARLEVDKLVPKAKPLPLGEGVSGITLYNSKWFVHEGADVTSIADWYFESPAIDKLMKLNLWNIEPNGYVRPHNTNIDPLTNNIDTMDMISWAWPYMLCMNEPGLDCHTIVEDFGIVPNQLGKTFLINPTKDRCIVNKGATASIRLFSNAQPGIQFQRFCDLITRSYLRQLAYQNRKKETNDV